MIRGHTLSENDFKARVIGYAKLRGWRVVHIRPARQGDRWVTPYEGDTGLPDLILARTGRVMLVELKSADGRFRPGQREWLAAAGDNGRLWRPVDWALIMDELR